jgi:hypothetical protein
MKKLELIFDVFSRRGKPAQPFAYSIPATFRNKMILLCRDTFSNEYNPYSDGNYTRTFWNEIHRMLQLRLGRFQLTESGPYPGSETDAMAFVAGCGDEEFLDFVEYMFRVDCLFHVVQDNNELVAQVNKLFALDGLGYELTDFITEERMEDTRFGKRPVIVTVAWPQVIKKDDQAIHETAIKPVLQFLGDPAFKSANLEYLDALKDYREGEWGDSLTKCCSSFESVMKIICEKKKWKYAQEDTANKLVETIVSKAGLARHFFPHLISIATLRNKYSKSHGAGVQPEKATPGIALFGLNLTASAILFLSQEIK